MTGLPRRLQVALLVLAATCSVASSASAEEPFYKGKRLTVMVNFAPGGSTDIEGRLFARHIAKHIDGQPVVVVQNMDGAGGLNGTAYVGEVAPKDGTMLGFLGGAAWQYASEPERHRVDLRTYEFIAYQPGTTVYYVRSDVAPGMKQAADIAKAQGLIAGGNGVHNARDLIIRLTLDILGVPHQYVTGFQRPDRAACAAAR
jgi:tripartite-type tricarboxylate transporter receptor subunit TctC